MLIHFATKSEKKMMLKHFTYNPKAKSMTSLTCHIILGSQNELLSLRHNNFFKTQ